MSVQHIREPPYYRCDEREGDCGERPRPVANSVKVSHLPIDLAAAFFYQEPKFFVTQRWHIAGVGLGFSECGHGVPGM
ncbi:hypothetical protein IQ60_32120 [Streptomyces europaeiscabiei]|nr:hypothetical protein IQ60_32120 [Streptomyces europaeiscabiei]